jgi:tetratricopeptide (TPR) repeat protein
MGHNLQLSVPNMLKIALLLLLSFSFNSSILAENAVPKTENHQQNTDTLELAKEWFKKAVAFDDEGDMAKCNEALTEALRLATAVNDHHLMGRTMNFLAINLAAEGKREESIGLSFRAFDQLMLGGDTVRAANVKINIGMDFNNQGKYEEALKIELEALDLRLQCGDSTNLATYYQHIGEVYKQLGIREKWKSSLEIARRLADNPKYASFATQISILNDFGGICEAEKRFDEAIKIYQKMYSRSKTKDYLNGMGTALANLSPVYLALNQPQKALKTTLEALQIQEKRENDYGRLTAYNQLGEIYLVLGQSNLSRENFLRGLNLAKDKDYVHERKISVDGLYRVARKMGNWKEALGYHENLIQLKDSLQNIDLQEKLTDIETRYQTEKKEQQIDLLNRENELKNAQLKSQRMVLWGGILLVAFAGSLLFLIVRQRRRQLQAKQNELEQKLLRSQMNPHFIFNSLGAIQSFMMKNDGRKAAFYLSSLSSLMRSILKNSREEWITLLEEKQTLENYLNLHQLRLGEKLSFTVSVASELEPESLILPPMLIQPFVENAIIHGIEEIEGNGLISVRFGKEKNQLLITVEDNGNGFETTEAKDGHVSYALQIFKERVANLKKTSGSAISYRIDVREPSNKQNPGTSVTVTLPLKFT